MSPWRTSLAVVTDDGNLLFFDLPTESGISPGGAVEIALSLHLPNLLPKGQIPTMESIQT